MAKNQTYKAFTARPLHVLDLNGELLNATDVMAELTTEVRGISAYATYVVRNDMKLGSELGECECCSACGCWATRGRDDA